jgi:hypothetical protein
MSPEANQGANPAAAARAAAFDREAFREALLARTMNQTTSARAAILPTSEALVKKGERETSRPMTDRYPVCRRWSSTALLLLSQFLHALACSLTLSIPVGKRPDASGPTPHPHALTPMPPTAGQSPKTWSPQPRAPRLRSAPFATWANCHPARRSHRKISCTRATC